MATKGLTSEEFVLLLIAADYEPRDYSGRGMMGDRCIAVVVKPLDTLDIGANLAYTAVAGVDPEAFDDPADLKAACEDAAQDVRRVMRETREDSMGLDRVVYWPEMKWDEEAAEHLGLEGR